MEWERTVGFFGSVLPGLLTVDRGRAVMGRKVGPLSGNVGNGGGGRTGRSYQWSFLSVFDGGDVGYSPG